MSQAMMEATNQSVCLLPDFCEDTDHVMKVKNLIEKMLVEYAEEGKQPDIGDIYHRVEKDLGMTEEFIDNLIDVSNPFPRPRPLEFYNC